MSKTSGSKLKVGPGAWIVMMLPAFLAAALVVILYANKVIGIEGAGVIIFLSSLPALVISFRYWGRMDEPTKEAHKFGFIWGWGMASVVVIMIGAALVYFAGARDLVQGWVEGYIAWSRGFLGTQEGAVGAYLAIIAAAMVQALAYLFVWLGWWARQRIGTKAD